MLWKLICLNIRLPYGTTSSKGKKTFSSQHLLSYFVLPSLLICFSVYEQPVKTGIYGTLVGLLNTKNFEFGREIVTKVSNELQELLKNVDFRRLRLLVRFIAELVNANVLNPSTLLSLLGQFLSVLSEDPSSDDKERQQLIQQRRSDAFAGVVMSTLLWVLLHFFPISLLLCLLLFLSLFFF
jgi:hypothetical protein